MLCTHAGCRAWPSAGFCRSMTAQLLHGWSRSPHSRFDAAPMSLNASKGQRALEAVSALLVLARAPPPCPAPPPRTLSFMDHSCCLPCREEVQMFHPASSNRLKHSLAALVCACVILISWQALKYSPPPRPQTTPQAKAREPRGLPRPLATKARRQSAEPAGALVARKTEAEPRVLDGLSAQGWILDGLGGPIAGATVVARGMTGGDKLEGTAVSGADGRFVISVASPSIELCAELNGYSLVCILAAAPSDGNTLRLLPASSIVGRVVMWDGGQGVPGATVQATAAMAPSGRAQTSRTDEDGHFTFAALSAGTYALTAVSPTARSREARVSLGIAETSDPVLLLAARGEQLTGEVFVAGAPCRSGRVRLSGHAFFEAEVLAGRVVFLGIFPGHYHSAVTCEGALTSAPVPIEIVDEPTHHVWKLDPLPSDARTVTDTATQATLAKLTAVIKGDGPIPEDLQIFAASRGMPFERARREGSNFVFDAMPLGQYMVFAQDRLEEGTSVELERAGDDTTVELHLTDGARLSGIVLDQHDTPVADALVSRTRADGVFAYAPAPVLTDVEGRFSLVSTKGARYQVTVSSPSGDAIANVVEGTDVIVRVAPRASVAGSVWARGGGLVSGFSGEIASQSGGEQYEVHGVDSQFFVPAIEPGEYELKLRSPLGDATRTLALAPGEALSLEIELVGGVE